MDEKFTTPLPGQPTSLWLATTPETSYPPFAGELQTEVAVLGGGIVGLLTAWLLRQAGLEVAIVEAGRILSGVTGHTTAKITSLHGQIYHYLTTRFGADEARLYAEANQAALARYAQLVEEKGIDCDFRRLPAFTYAESEEEFVAVGQEAEAARAAGLAAELVQEADLPFPIRGAVRLPAQALFHPRKFLLPLAEELVSSGGKIFEKTRALHLRPGHPAQVETDRGTLRAAHVVLATNFPFFDPTLFAARMYPKRSYVLAVRIAGQVPQGMYYSSAEPYRSLRPHPLGGEEYLLLGGENHKTGEGGSTSDRYRRLETFARRHFELQSVDYRWSTQDPVTMDRIPFIGAPVFRNIHVAAGFGGWGMTQGLIAAQLLTDQIRGIPNRWGELYHPTRLSLKGGSRFLRENLDAAKHLFKDRLISPSTVDPDRLAPGEGGVISTGEGKTGVALDRRGNRHCVAATCTHLGCIVAWNDAEESWDCPCHGSRFAADGGLLHGPAVRDLEARTQQPS
ncbi:MAG: FAD-dependent oxidoreductase [Desulfuromonadales bacterium]|nr:FAD-dependent oxidoreductase [Desulfuromonadales bacterium]